MYKLSVKYNLENGTIDSISNNADKYMMNWVEGNSSWGMLKNAEFISCEKIQDGISAIYKTYNLKVFVTRRLIDGRLREEYRFKNDSKADVFIRRGDIGIYATFNDNYDLAEKCLNYRCHTHIWCGGEVSYVIARKMGMCDYGLGLFLLEGSLDCYSSERDISMESNDRGDFILHPSPFILSPGEEKLIAWELFFCEDGDFYREFEKYPRGIIVRSDAFTVFENETIEFSVNRPDARVFLGEHELTTEVRGNKTFVSLRPDRLGEYIFTIQCGPVKTKAEFYVQTDFESLVKSRVEFIVNKQQYHREGSPIDGAYLIYDNEEDSMYFDNLKCDYNASRERIGMGLLVAKYLQYFPDNKILESFMKYYRFVTREYYNEETGEVFDTVGMDPTQKRLYNAPWVSMLVMELYKLTGDKSYLVKMCKILDVYYSIGAERFYPNGLTMLETVDVLKNAGMNREADALLEKFKVHVDNIIKIGMDYPPHEVKFEQTIVSPGAALIAQMCMLTSDKSLIAECEKQVKLLERFNSEAPSYHLNQLAIRHWDAFWFGKRRRFGDTFPHIASIHSSDAFLQYAQISGDEHYRAIAIRGMRNNLCCFRADGRAYSSYVYPFRINGEPGEYYDPYANEQDAALYLMIKYFGLLDRK